MPVYVDKMRAKFGRMLMCHMLADTVEELHEMARKLGLKRSWFQDSKSSMPHYDISLGKKRLAIELGAAEIGNTKVVELIRLHRENRKKEKDND